MTDAHGIIFAQNTSPRLKELTHRRTTASVPFGGRYRIIDFMLSSLVNAGVTDVGVIVQDNYQSLLDHLGSGRDWDLAETGGLSCSPFWLRRVGRCSVREAGSSARGGGEYLNAFVSLRDPCRRGYHREPAA
jgi:glucose-1-phosphate adenylyltransferase